MFDAHEASLNGWPPCTIRYWLGYGMPWYVPSSSLSSRVDLTAFLKRYTTHRCPDDSQAAYPRQDFGDAPCSQDQAGAILPSCARFGALFSKLVEGLEGTKVNRQSRSVPLQPAGVISTTLAGDTHSMARAAVTTGAPFIILLRSRLKDLYLIVKTLKMGL